MKVLDLTPFSDHKPLSMELHCKHIKIECMLPLEQQYEPAPTRFIFNEGNRDAFIQGLGTESSQQTLKDLQDTIDRLRDSTTDNNSLTTTTINATNCFRQSKHMNTNKQNKPWFNWQTRTGKQELRKATTTVSGYPDSSFLRDNYYKVEGCYKKLINSTKNTFFAKLNEDIEGGKVLNWQAFKKIKRHKETKIQHDSYDMEKFEKFLAIYTPIITRP